MQKLREEKFDAMFTEQLTPCGSALAEVLEIPVQFLVSSCALFEAIGDVFGINMPGGYVPAALAMTTLSDEMSFTDRIRNEIEFAVVRRAYTTSYNSITKLFRKHYGHDFPEVTSIIKRRTPVIFIATEDFIDFPRPWPADVIRIGGLGMNYKTSTSTKLSLNEPFTSEMKKGVKGVVFFSLGSNTNTAGLPESVKTNIFGTFINFPEYHFIVKIDKDDHRSLEILKKAPNVYITTWAPQPALLQHHRLELFITHGGYNSILEVAVTGKPVLLLPMMHDQMRNAAVVKRNGWGRNLNRHDLLKTNKFIKDELTEILNTDK